MQAAVVRRSVQALGATALLRQPRCSSRVPPFTRPPRAATVVPSPSGQGLRASFWGRPITTLAAAGAAGADALPYPEPAPAARDDVKSEEEWHRLIDEWAARLEEDLPHLREHIYEAVVMLKRATPLLMRVLDEGGFMTVCFAALHRVDPNVPVEARGLSDEAAAEFAQRSDTPLASDEDEIRKPLTQAFCMSIKEARKVFPCDGSHALGFAYDDPYFAKQVEALVQQCVRHVFGLKFGRHTLFKKCGTPRGGHSKKKVHVVSIVFSVPDTSLPQLAFAAFFKWAAALTARDSSGPLSKNCKRRLTAWASLAKAAAEAEAAAEAAMA